MLKYKALLDSTGGETTVYYDYVENGRLKGGRTTIILPPLPDKGFMEAATLWNVTTIVDNGPTSNRIDIVFVGDGYTAAEMVAFANHTDNVLGLFMAEEPIAAYSTYFNIHRVDVISNESGVDEPDLGIYRDTALDMNFNCSGIARLLCIDASKAVLAAGNAPDVDHTLALANSTRYGGAGYAEFFLATLAGDNSSSVELALHEFGHSFANLADEYYYNDGSTYTGPEPTIPNVSIYTAQEQLNLQTKWYRWLDESNVGTYEGAYYEQYGIYRPTYNSKMRGLNRPFEQINVERFIIEIYKIVSPIDDATPSSAMPLPCDTTFFVTPLQPADHNLDIQWSLNGEDVLGAIGPNYTPDVFLLPAGIHDVAVRVVDNTSRVRNENAIANYLTVSRQWQIEKFFNPDLDGNEFVGINDFCLFIQHWMETDCNDNNNWCDGADMDHLNGVNMEDFALFAQYWFTGTNRMIDIKQSLNATWIYQNLPTSTNSELTAAVSITDDPMANNSYTYDWEFILPDDVSVSPTITGGGGSTDPCCKFAAPGCDEPNGLSDSGSAFTVKVTVIGDNSANTGTAEAQFGIALLGDVNNDGVVNVADRSIINAFWRTGSAGSFSLRDCDLNNDGSVNVADRSIANVVWRGTLGANSVSNPCPLRQGQAPSDMVFIPGGEFEMGVHFEEGYHDERPVHAVLVDSFFMSKFEITNQQYCDYLNSTYPGQIKVVGGVVYASSDDPCDYPYCDIHSYDTDSQIDFSDPDFSVRTKDGRDMSDDPIMEVSWYGAASYCNWRSSEEGYESCYNLSTWECDFSKHGYHLPTEAEWEYAARGGQHNPYYRFGWGDTISHSQANYNANGNYSFDLSYPNGFHPDWNDGIEPYTSVVGSFSPNGYGLYDMAGNVWEWCNDRYDSNYYNTSPYDNPTGPAGGTYRVLRGCNWYSNAFYCRVAYRDYHPPHFRYGYYGFRIVLDLN